MGEPTRAQRRILDRMSEGEELIRHFDVWGGYSWILEPLTIKVRSSTVLALTRLQLIEEGNNERVFSGRQQMAYSLTPAGRAALSKTPGRGE